jgi:hypothetical protein
MRDAIGGPEVDKANWVVVIGAPFFVVSVGLKWRIAPRLLNQHFNHCVVWALSKAESVGNPPLTCVENPHATIGVPSVDIATVM